MEHPRYSRRTVEYESGGSAPTYAALDRARNELDALKAARAAAMDAIRDALAALQQATRCSDRARLHAIDCIVEAIDDMTFSEEAEITNEITDLEDRLGDGA